MTPRKLQDPLRAAARKYPVLALVGPRQSGKTTLAKLAFPRKPYASLEDPDTLAFAREDPRGFLAGFPDGAVLDEAQRAPELFSYIQTLVDEKRRDGMFVLTGSQHFGLMERISQSLAGRVWIGKLMPFSLEELSGPWRPSGLDALLFKGGYPRIYDKSLPPTDWLAQYVETYLARDVRMVKNVGDLSVFHKFLRMSAGRCGSLLNLSSLADDCGLSHNTVKAWLSVLEASFLVFLLPPHHRNFNKRLKKAPKLYFHDTGLLCYLLGVTRASELSRHSMRGAVFESFVLSEMRKAYWNRGRTPRLYFWQDKLGREVDCLIERSETLIPVEIKSGQTLSSDHFRNLGYWCRLSGTPPEKAHLVYAGTERQDRGQARVLGWRDVGKLPM